MTDAERKLLESLDLSIRLALTRLRAGVDVPDLSPEELEAYRAKLERAAKTVAYLQGTVTAAPEDGDNPVLSAVRWLTETLETPPSPPVDTARHVPDGMTAEEIDAAEKRYLKDPTCCPFCGDDEIEGDSVNIEEGFAYQPMGCANCDAEWDDRFSRDRIVVQTTPDRSKLPPAPPQIDPKDQCPTCGKVHAICRRCGENRVQCPPGSPGEPYVWCNECEKRTLQEAIDAQDCECEPGNFTCDACFYKLTGELKSTLTAEQIGRLLANVKA